MNAPRARLAKKSSLLWTKWDVVVRKNRRAVAIVEAETGRAWNRAEISAWAEALAAGPLACSAGECVGFSLSNSAEWIAVFLALQRVGAAAIPLDPSLTANQQDALAEALRLRFVWRDGALRAACAAGRASQSMQVGKLTSGSTGEPRLIRCSAAHLLADGTNIMRTMRIRPSDRNLALIPLGHSYGLGNLVAPLLLQGTSLICARAFVPRQIPGWIKKHRATVLPTVPAVLSLLAALPGRARLGLLKLVISAGARLPAETACDFTARFGLRVHNFYGSSETGGICYDRRGTASIDRESVGTALRGVTVALTPRGRIHVTSEAVAAGRGGEFTLPDLGKFNARGEIEIIGRAGRVANIGGRNIHPREIESRLARLPGVSDAWVHVLARAGRDYLVAAVETSRPREEIVSDFNQLVAPWQRPRFWLVLPRLPRTERGKLDAPALRARLEAGNLKARDGRG